MASGKVHDNHTVWLTGSLVLAAAITGESLLLYAAAGAAANLICSPDMDLADAPRKPNPVRRWSFLHILWLPYAWLVPHRHAVSHSPVWSTLLRVVYLGAIALIFGIIPNFRFFPALFFFFGLALADILHLFDDGIL